MARIRSVHPGLATDEAFMSMSMAARAAWPLLWTECDDQGVFEWKPLVLKARIFPADSIDFSTVLAEWVDLDCIKSFEHQGKRFGIVRNFCKYQRPKKPNSVYPVPDDFRTYSGKNSSNDVEIPEELETSSPPVPHQFPTDGENHPQMEDGGWRMEDGEVYTSPDPVATAVSEWNDMASRNGLPRKQSVTATIRKKIPIRLSEIGGIEGWRVMLGKIEASSYLRGKVNGWRVSFDWVLSPTNLAKIMEGNYDDHRPQANQRNGANSLQTTAERARAIIDEAIRREAAAVAADGEDGAEGDGAVESVA